MGWTSALTEWLNQPAALTAGVWFVALELATALVVEGVIAVNVIAAARARKAQPSASQPATQAAR